jgi:Ca2+-binding EF-hand superfamily protein
MRRFAVCLMGTALLAMTSVIPAQNESVADDPAALFEKLDVNKDGTVTSQEIPDSDARLFRRLLRLGDKDESGDLSKDEFVAASKDRPAPPPDQPPNADRPRPDGFPPPEQIFSRLDANGDGKIEKSEVPEDRREQIGRILSAADSDADGAVTREEFLKASERLAPFRRPEPGGNESPMPGMGAAGERLLRTLDADGDGTLSAEEIAQASEQLLKLDRNGDGRLSPRELIPEGRPMPAGGAAPAFDAEAIRRRLRQADKDGDGKLSADEVQGPLKERFDELDANSDGFLDQAETARAVGRLLRRPPGDANR